MKALVIRHRHAGKRRFAAAADVVALVAQPAREQPAPLYAQAAAQLAIQAQIALAVVKPGDAARVEQIVRTRMVHEQARRAAPDGLGIAKVQLGFVRDGFERDERAAVGKRLGHAPHIQVREAGAVRERQVIGKTPGHISYHAVVPLPEAGHGQRQAVVPAVRRIGRFVRGAAALRVRERQPRRELAQGGRLPQQLQAGAARLEVLIRVALGKARVHVVNEGVALAGIHRQARGQLVGHQRPGNHRRSAPRAHASSGYLRRAFTVKRRLLGVHHNGPGNAVGPLRNRLRAAKHLDALHIPQRLGAKHQLVVAQVAPVHIDGGARHRAAQKGARAKNRPLRVLPANHRRGNRARKHHIGHVFQRLLHRRAPRLRLDILRVHLGNR